MSLVFDEFPIMLESGETIESFNRDIGKKHNGYYLYYETTSGYHKFIKCNNREIFDFSSDSEDTKRINALIKQVQNVMLNDTNECKILFDTGIKYNDVSLYEMLIHFNRIMIFELYPIVSKKQYDVICDLDREENYTIQFTIYKV